MPIQKLKLALQQTLPGLATQMLMAPPIRTANMLAPAHARKGGVCILLFKKKGSWYFLLIKRTEDGGIHSGQISLPGGKMDATDYSITYTAIRELEEEIGVLKNDIQIIGMLTKLYIPPSNFMVYPIVAIIEKDFMLKLAEAEVQDIIEIKISDLLNANNKNVLEVKRSDDNSQTILTPIYKINEQTIWGATAMILRELEAVL